MGPFTTAWTPVGPNLQFLWIMGTLRLMYKHFRASIQRSLTPMPFEPCYGRTRVLLTIICLVNPPLAVALFGDSRHADVVLSILLTCLGFLPGVLHAVFFMNGEITRQRASAELRKQHSVINRLHDTFQPENSLSLYRQMTESATRTLEAENPNHEVTSSYSLQDIYQWFVSQAQRVFPATLSRRQRITLAPQDPASVLDNLGRSFRRPFQDRSRLFHLSTKTVLPGREPEHAILDLAKQAVPQLNVDVSTRPLSTISDSMLNTVSSASIVRHAAFAKSAPDVSVAHEQPTKEDPNALKTSIDEKALRRVDVCSPMPSIVGLKSTGMDDIGGTAQHLIGSTLTAVSDQSRDVEERLKQRPLAGFVRGLHQIGEAKRF